MDYVMKHDFFVDLIHVEIIIFIVNLHLYLIYSDDLYYY